MSKDEYAKIESLILEQMRALRSDIAALKQNADLTNAQLRVMNQHVAAIVGNDALNAERFAILESRVEHVEKRLELRDT